MLQERLLKSVANSRVTVRRSTSPPCSEDLFFLSLLFVVSQLSATIRLTNKAALEAETEAPVETCHRIRSIYFLDSSEPKHGQLTI